MEQEKNPAEEAEEYRQELERNRSFLRRKYFWLKTQIKRAEKNNLSQTFKPKTGMETFRIEDYIARNNAGEIDYPTTSFNLKKGRALIKFDFQKFLGEDIDKSIEAKERAQELLKGWD